MSATLIAFLLLVPYFGFHAESSPANAVPAISMASMPKRYCMSAVLTDVPFDKTFMPDEKRTTMWNIGFRKSVQHDVLRMMIEIGMCDRYQYSKVRCFRNEADLTKVWLEVGAIATLEQMQKVTSALQNGVAKMGPYYAFSQSPPKRVTYAEVQTHSQIILLLQITLRCSDHSQNELKHHLEWDFRLSALSVGFHFYNTVLQLLNAVGGSKPQRYCVETTVKGIELKDFLAECDYEGIPQPVTDLNKKVDDKTVHMLEKAINFDV
ncbi:hypothetical protein TTRE_0000005201 [Trichuris trichiura]|uniref:Uncharacterized protein n=1 Tax=Trichuris trichiura TaxID=36087 RepID=A0A077YWH5_TRITR|nr:hypothetical protein TTRE_0000005201 [Trichuris trichiura]